MDQVVLKLQLFISKKIPDQRCSKIPDQEIKYWSTKYLEMTIKDKIWYIHDFFEPVSNDASSFSSFNAAIV